MTVTKLRQVLQRLERSGMGSRIVRCPLHTATEVIAEGGVMPYRPVDDIRTARVSPRVVYLVAEGEPDWEGVTSIRDLPPKRRNRGPQGGGKCPS